MQRSGDALKSTRTSAADAADLALLEAANLLEQGDSYLLEVQARAPDGPLGYNKKGSFEGFCSGGGIAQLARRRVASFTGKSVLQSVPPAELTARLVGEAAVAGDALALELWRDVGEKLGEALALLVDVLNPERFVIGSIYARCERFVAPAMQAALEREALPQSAQVCTVVPAVLGDEIGSYAAVAIARYHAGV